MMNEEEAKPWCFEIDSSLESSIDLAADVESLKPMAISTMPSRIGPPSVIGKDDIREWRKRYSLRDDAILQVPSLGNQDSDFGVDEMIGYEALFKSGFKDNIPSLVATIFEYNMVNSILTLGGIFKLFKILASSRILLWRSMKFSSPIMCILLTEAKEGSTIILGVELLKGDRKRHVSDKKWAERFAFMNPPGYYTLWYFLVDISLHASTTDKEMVDRGTCYELHELKIWWLTRCYPAVLPLTMGSFAGIKHEAVGELDPPTSGGKKAKSSGVATRSFHQSPYLILLQVKVMSNLNTKVMSQLYYFGEKMNTEVSAAIPEELVGDKDRCIAQKRKARNLMQKVKAHDEAEQMAAAEKEMVNLRVAVETISEEMVMKVNGVRIMARWELIRECLSNRLRAETGGRAGSL
ncbi:LOW QUALITY PROTEIN: hypothetical protein HID58_001932 [Brassica napus]|uniref:Uncharacterized protein n=1 Tax=Brassica napus TaxID=3708 RepID=A0ABQ8ENR3_BRANA|nr:LOW QUALITY PROTEIN: hypothetical protein HID58_001932 [Brassica napus]